MAANAFIKRWDITNLSGWVRLSDVPLVLNVQMRPVAGNQIDLRYKGGASVLMPNDIFVFEGVDLYDFEISTTSPTSVGFVVTGYSR